MKKEIIVDINLTLDRVFHMVNDEVNTIHMLLLRESSFFFLLHIMSSFKLKQTFSIYCKTNIKINFYCL
jgi:hypothetical protein